MKTYKEVLAKYQPELDRIETERDVALTMYTANVKMELQETLDSLTPEQADIYIEAWNAALRKDKGWELEYDTFTWQGRTIYDSVEKELGINELPRIT